MNKLLVVTLLIIFCKTASAQVLIKNTNVIDVENKKVLAGYDVLSVDGKIVSIDRKKDHTVPAGTRVIDGTEKYLIPGLTDAHVHFFQSGSMFARPDAIDLRKNRPYKDEIKYSHDNMEDFLRRYLSIGITSVVDVGSTNHFLAQRDSFANKSYAPQIAMTGALLTTYMPPVFKDLGDDAPFVEMKTEEGARQTVRDMKAHHADFIKIWYIVLDADVEKGARKNLPLVQAVIDEAHKNNMRVAVHATERVTAQLAAEAGADYLVHNVDDEVISDDFIQLLKKKNIVLCPTMMVATNYASAFGHTYHFSADELAVANPFTVGSIINFPEPDTILGKGYIRTERMPRAIARQAHMDSLLAVNLKKLRDGGITIATGTDAGNIGTQHAGCYFNELKAMQAAGFNMWDLLVSSTINGAKAMARQNTDGSITKGKTASMVLLNANPLDSLANWRKIDFVINRGVALRPDSLINNTPEMLAQQQLNGFNAGDLEAFLLPYADSVQVFDPQGKMMMKDKNDMRAQYAPFFSGPGLYVHLLNRIVQGNTVVDHEEIHIPGSDKKVYGIVVYKIEGGKISKMICEQQEP